MLFKKTLVSLLQQACKTLYHIDVPAKQILIQATKKGFEGTHTLLLFPLQPLLPQDTHLVSQALGAWLTTHHGHLVAKFQTLDQFLNLTFTDAAWLGLLQSQEKEIFCVSKPQKIIIEIACPNTNKPLHLGHLRNSFIGDAVANILQAVGHEVKKLMHVNDRGVHICKSMYAYQQDPHPQTPEQANIKGDHVVGNYYVAFDRQHKKEIETLVQQGIPPERARKEAPCMVAVQEMLRQWEAGDPATLQLWQTMNTWVYQGFDATYANLGIGFDKIYYESETYLSGKHIVEEGVRKGIFYKENGAVWVNLSNGKTKKLLLRADGTAVYITQDLGTADLRYSDFQADRSIYVVGNEQEHHFKVLFDILKQLRRPYADSLMHLSYGMVELPEGKMKSREGTVVDADHLIDKMLDIAQAQTMALGKTEEISAPERQTLYHTLAMGALKFFLLKINPKKTICFDPKRSIEFQGYTGPFIQYTHARITTLLAKAQTEDCPTTCPAKIPLSIEGRELAVQLAQCNTILLQAATALDPSIVAQYLYHVAKTYNQFYAYQVILQEQDKGKRQLRLYLSSCTARILQRLALLLGILLPRKM